MSVSVFSNHGNGWCLTLLLKITENIWRNKNVVYLTLTHPPGIITLTQISSIACLSYGSISITITGFTFRESVVSEGTFITLVSSKLYSTGTFT